MTRKYSLVIEGTDSSYSGYVPELPAILVTGQSLEEVTDRASGAIRVYWEKVKSEWSAESMVREIEVELPV
jgi:predicted RNase H-like HicB family nuclease